MAHLLPEGADHDARELLEEHLDVRAGRARPASTTFYDTFDGRLHGEGSCCATPTGALDTARPRDR